MNNKMQVNIFLCWMFVERTTKTNQKTQTKTIYMNIYYEAACSRLLANISALLSCIAPLSDLDNPRVPPSAVSVPKTSRILCCFQDN